MHRNSYFSNYSARANFSLEETIKNAFLKADLTTLNNLLTDPEIATKVEKILFNLCYQANLSNEKKIWSPLATLFLNSAKSDEHFKLLKISLAAIKNPYSYSYDKVNGQLYAIDLAIQQNALMNFKLIVETSSDRLDAADISKLQAKYSKNEHIELTLRRLKMQLASPSEQNTLIAPFSKLGLSENQVYQDENITQLENLKRMQIKNKVKASLNYFNSSAPIINSYMPRWEESYLYAAEYPILYAATGQVFSVNGQETFRYCSGTHIGEGYFLTAGHCNDSCLTEICAALSTIRVTFDYQYDQQGEYEQMLINQYRVEKLVYNGFIIEPNESELDNGEKYDDYLVFKLDTIPPQAVACIAEIPSQGDPVTMMHHPNGMLKKISFGKIVAIKDGVYGEEKLKSDIEHNAHDWGGSSGSGLYWNNKNAIFAVHVASYNFHSTCSTEYPGSAVSIKRIASDIQNSPIFKKDQDMQNVHRLLTSQGLFKNTGVANKRQATSSLANAQQQPKPYVYY